MLPAMLNTPCALAEDDGSIIVHTVDALEAAIDNGYTDITLELEAGIEWNTSYSLIDSSSITIEILGNITAASALNGVDASYYAISGSANNTIQVKDSTNLDLTDILFADYTCINGSLITYSSATGKINNSIFTNLSNPYTLNAGTISIYESDVDIDGSLFSNNTAASNGGSLYIYSNSVVTIDHSIFDSNKTTGYYADNLQGGGGAISVRSSEAWISNSTFSNNSSYTTGGAIANAYSSSKIYISDSSFTGNSANSSGGAIYNNYFATATIENSSFDHNEATNGGAIYNYYASYLYIYDSDFSENGATTSGGAIYNYYATASVEGSSFEDNSANYYGGAIYNYYGAILSVTDSSFESNEAASGGAIYNVCSATLKVYDSSFSNNKSDASGGAISNVYSNNYTSKTYVYDSEFTGNSAATYGGAIYNYTSFLYIYDSVFTGNTASINGGAIYNDAGYVYLFANDSDTVFTGNTANGESSAIYQSDDSSRIYIYASSDTEGAGRVVFNDAIAGVGTIYLNDNSSYQGSVVLNADMSGYTGTVYFEQGTIVVGSDMGKDADTSYTNFFNGDFVVSSSSSTSTATATLDAGNGVMDKFDLSNWDISEGLNLVIDINLSTQESDFFANAFDVQNITISEIVLSGDLIEESAYIYISDASEGFYISEDIDKIVSGYYQYTISAVYLEGDAAHADGFYLYFDFTLIPEPSTATLSLLALCGLCARRRRRQCG